MRKTCFAFISILVVLILCTCDGPYSNVEIKETNTSIALNQIYEPVDGECLVFIGQELDAIGGLEKWNSGYLDHFDSPFGFTMYTDFFFKKKRQTFIYRRSNSHLSSAG